MTKLEWELTESREQKKDYGAWERRGKSRAWLHEAPVQWGEHSAPAVGCAVAFILLESQDMLEFYLHRVTATASLLHEATAFWSRDAQSEPVEVRCPSASAMINWDASVSFARAWTEMCPGVSALGVERRSGIPIRRETVSAEAVDAESRAREVVNSLQRHDLEHEERRKLILEAEMLPFRGQEAAALAPILRQFIEEYRESNVPADLVAVGSAIRNYVATAPTDEAFDAAAGLLRAEGRLPLPIELEVEVAKMVVRKLTANPPAERDRYPELALRLEELVDAYAKPRFLAREKHGAVALNATLGLVLTRSGRDPVIVDKMRKLAVPWFQQLLGRRAARLRSDLVTRDSDAKLADSARTLGELSKLDSTALVS